MTGTLPTAATHRERLHVPLRWWVQGVMLVASFWLALVVALPFGAALLITALALALLVALLAGYGAARVEVADQALRAGRARIELAHLGTSRVLDARATRHRSGPGADARAMLLLRPYLAESVEVEITDPADPTPYWLIETRHPEQLRAALDAARADRHPTD